VLNVGIGQPLAGTIPLIALQQLTHDVQGRLLIAMQHRVVIHEQ